MKNPYSDIPTPALYSIERVLTEDVQSWEKIGDVYRDELPDENNEKIARENAQFFREQLDLVEAILSGNK